MTPPPKRAVLLLLQTAFVVERFGKYNRTLAPVLHVLIPVVRVCWVVGVG